MPLTQPSYRYRIIWMLLGWGMVAGVVLLSLIPVEVDLGEDKDKLAHFVAYGSLSFWFGMIVGGRWPQLGIAVAFAAMGAGLEFVQGLTDYRSFEIADMVANTVGSGLGWCLLQTPLKHGLVQAERLFVAATRRP